MFFAKNWLKITKMLLAVRILIPLHALMDLWQL